MTKRERRYIAKAIRCLCENDSAISGTNGWEDGMKILHKLLGHNPTKFLEQSKTVTDEEINKYPERYAPENMWDI